MMVDICVVRELHTNKHNAPLLVKLNERPCGCSSSADYGICYGPVTPSDMHIIWDNYIILIYPLVN